MPRYCVSWVRGNSADCFAAIYEQAGCIPGGSYDPRVGSPTDVDTTYLDMFTIG